MRLRRFLPVFVLFLLIAGTVPLSTPAKAGTSYTWTSTADFDGGNKGTPTTQGSWSIKAAAIHLVADPSGWPYNGKLYVFGGSELPGTTATNYTQIYTPATNSWASGTAIPAKSWGAVTLGWADRIYVIGGSPSSAGASKRVDIYNTTTNSWTTGTSCPVFLTGGAGGSVYGNYFFIQNRSTFYRYDVVGDSWLVRAASPVYDWPTLATIGSYLYSIGEKTSVPAGQVVSRYDIVGNSWTVSYDTAAPFHSRYAGFQFDPIYQGKIWFGYGASATGYVWNQYFRDMWSYEPIGKVWTQYTEGQYWRDGVGASGWINGKFYVVSGRVGTVNPVQGSTYNEEFDPTGTTSEGAHSVESVTDNPNVAAGAVQLASKTADLFTLPDVNGNTWKWNESTDIRGACQFIIAGGVFYLATGDSSGIGSCSAHTSHGYTGDIDVRVKASSPTGRALNFLVLNEIVPQSSSTTTVDGYWIQMTGSGPHTASGIRLTNAASTICSSQAGLPEPVWFRINYTASTTTWGWWTSPDGVIWTNRNYCVNSVAGTLYPQLGGQWNTGTGNMSYDDFQVTNGTATAGIYRTAGNWTSPLQTYGGEIPHYLNLTYSGLSASAYIDSVRILNSAGAVLYANNTDITGGTSESISIPPAANLETDWKVQVILAGNGSVSPILESVSVFTVGPLHATATADTTGAFVPVTIQFTSTSTGGLLPYNYTWDFGDGSLAYTQNPSHAYPTSGIYTVTFTVRDADGNTATDTITLRLGDRLNVEILAVFLILAFGLLAFGIYTKNVILVILSAVAFLILGALSWGPSLADSALAALEMATGGTVLIVSIKVLLEARS